MTWRIMRLKLISVPRSVPGCVNAHNGQLLCEFGPVRVAGEERRRPEAIVSHQSAAAIQNLGSITTNWLNLSGPHRINVRNQRTRSHRRPLGSVGIDWHLYEGLPVATPARIVSDLAGEVIDGGHLGTVLEHCLDDDLLTRTQLVDLCAPHARRWQLRAGDGDGLVDLLLSSAREPIGA